MIIFRADGNSLVGVGHVMRCLSIADAFKKVGESCLFITSDNIMSKTIRERGHKNLVLGLKYDHMDEEIDLLKKAITTKKTKVIFIDSYFVTERYLESLRDFCVKKHILLVYIDDVLAFPYPCDVLLNYNIYASSDEYSNLYKGCVSPEFMLGTAYAPQREEFQNLSDRIVNRQGKNILISTGGADSEHISLEIIKTIIASNKWKDYKFHVIVGSMNRDKDKIYSLAAGWDNIEIYEEVIKMADLMRSCDVAISAAGSTLYELCSTQTPTITYILADNQILGAKGFEEKGVLHCAGDVRRLGGRLLAEKVLSAATKLVDNFEERCRISQKMKAVIDGKGAERIVKEIIGN